MALVKDETTGLHDELRSVKSDVSEIKQSLTELNKRDKEDSDAFAQTLVKHGKRLAHLEKDVKQLKLKQA